MKTCNEKALEWNVSPRSVNDMCKKGRIQGAIKQKEYWLIPDDASRPVDGRVLNGKYVKKNMNVKAEIKSLPIGISDYVRAQEEYYYVDKTLLIKEFLNQKPLVIIYHQCIKTVILENPITNNNQRIVVFFVAKPLEVKEKINAVKKIRKHLQETSDKV